MKNAYRILVLALLLQSGEALAGGGDCAVTPYANTLRAAAAQAAQAEVNVGAASRPTYTNLLEQRATYSTRVSVQVTIPAVRRLRPSISMVPVTDWRQVHYLAWSTAQANRELRQEVDCVIQFERPVQRADETILALAGARAALAYFTVVNSTSQAFEAFALALSEETADDWRLEEDSEHDRPLVWDLRQLMKDLRAQPKAAERTIGPLASEY